MTSGRDCDDFLDGGPGNDELVGAWRAVQDRQEAEGVSPFDKGLLNVVPQGDRYIYRIGPLDLIQSAFELLRAKKVLPDDNVKVVRLLEWEKAQPDRSPFATDIWNADGSPDRTPTNAWYE